MHTLNAYLKDLMCGHLCLYIGVNNYTIFWRLVGCIPKGFNSVINKFSRIYPSRDQESHYTEKMQNLQLTLTEERDKVVMNANQQKSMLEESLHHTKSEEQRLRTKLAEAEEVRFFLFCFVLFCFKHLYLSNVSFAQGKDNAAYIEIFKKVQLSNLMKMNLV